MSVELIASLAIVVLGGGWALIKAYGLLVGQIVAQFKQDLDKRFEAIELARQEGRKAWDERLKGIERKQDELERDVRKILIELPREYVRREDYVRNQTLIEAKIDQLSLRIQNWILEKNNAG